MTKYLFIATNEGSSWGGSEPLWIYAAQKLASRGNEVRVNVPEFHKDGPLLDCLKASGCRMIYRPRFPPFFFRMRHRISPQFEYKLHCIRAWGEAVDLVVISQGGNADGLEWAEAARKAGLTYVIIVQCASEVNWPDDATAQRLALVFGGAARTFFVSQANLDLTQRQFATSLSSAKVIRNPYNVPYDASPTWPLDLPVGLSLACIARLETCHKGQDLLLNVLNLRHWRERKVRVSLIGRGPNENALRNMAESLQLTNVTFDGHQNDVEDVWSRHHGLVLPSRFEGMPLVVVEAMLCGRPCIVTDVGGSRELIRDGVNGFLARAATVELLDEAMNRAWDNRSRLREMGERAALDARNFVSPDPAEDFVRELESLLVHCD
jgi:glycosyltransferase involved in cell wall biosynthesis